MNDPRDEAAFTPAIKVLRERRRRRAVLHAASSQRTAAEGKPDMLPTSIVLRTTDGPGTSFTHREQSVGDDFNMLAAPFAVRVLHRRLRGPDGRRPRPDERAHVLHGDELPRLEVRRGRGIRRRRKPDPVERPESDRRLQRQRPRRITAKRQREGPVSRGLRVRSPYVVVAPATKAAIAAANSLRLSSQA